MLGKLINYEMKAYTRIMVPIYIALLALAAIIGFTLRMAPSSVTQNFVFILAMILYVLLIVAVAILTTILGINRYYGNLLGREGYFMFSLPARTSTMMLSKTLSAMIWTFFGAIVGFGAIMLTNVVSISGEDYTYTWEAFKQLFEYLKPHLGSVIFWIVIVILELVTVIVRVYAAVSIGSQWSGHRLIGSVLVYIGFKVIEVIIAQIAHAIRPVRDALEGIAAEGGFNTKLQILALVLILVQLVIYWVIAWYFTDRKLNLE